jgi:hypothetical protein
MPLYGVKTRTFEADFELTCNVLPLKIISRSAKLCRCHRKEDRHDNEDDKDLDYRRAALRMLAGSLHIFDLLLKLSFSLGVSAARRVQIRQLCFTTIN